MYSKVEDKKILKRVSIKVTYEVWEYFRTKSDLTGVSASALMYFVLENYVRKQKEIEMLSHDRKDIL